ncbi:ABC transporter permease [Amnibacterium flavum]|uniref:Nickel ABC transporter permease n=1 Tax=Amnibacterium flavum TaxID=2173173 RepID=A0A2V1HW95_9MICO|nr:ABC transporter permease [Amnibacterium flavum]PVZ95380.1 nickel ABC transporter permease [Amnibacterium flavum]
MSADTSAIYAAGGEPSAADAPPIGGKLKIRADKVVIGVSVLLLMLVAGYIVPAVTGFTELAQDLGNRLQPPSTAHPFGTDDLGRDVFVRALYAARLDLPLAIAGALLPAAIGTTIGLIAGYSGRIVDTVLMRIGDFVQAFPSYVLLVVVAYIVGPGIGSFLLAVGVISWVAYARLIRSQVLVIRELDYVHSARLAGLGRGRVMTRHVLPNALSQTLVFMASDATLSLLFLSGISFLGLGIAAPTPEWGGMINEGRLYLATAWWLTTFPGLMLVLAAGAFVLISDGLDDRNRA